MDNDAEAVALGSPAPAASSVAAPNFPAGTRVVVTRKYGDPVLGIIQEYDATSSKYEVALGAHGQEATIVVAVEQIAYRPPPAVASEANPITPEPNPIGILSDRVRQMYRQMIGVGAPTGDELNA